MVSLIVDKCGNVGNVCRNDMITTVVMVHLKNKECIGNPRSMKGKERKRKKKMHKKQYKGFGEGWKRMGLST